MNSKLLKYPLLLALLVLFPIIVPATDLPSLPMSGQVRKGRLANGINYYIVTNTAERGKADIALVQKVGWGSEQAPRTAGETRVRARAGITDLPHFVSPSPIVFMAGSGIWPRETGYVTVTDDATEYRFDDIDLLLRQNAVDSTLLLVFDIIGNVSGPMSEMYSPSNQAVIISGDVDAAGLVNKMEMLSLLVTERISSEGERTALSQAGPFLSVSEPDNSRLATVTVIYDMERVPHEDIGTVQPLVLRKYAAEFELILRRRLEQAFRKRDIPLSEIGFDYISSARSSSDEQYRISVSVSQGDLDEASGIVASVLADIDSHGVTAAEYASAEARGLMEMKAMVRDGLMSNSYYVDRCKAAFLYGSSLASPSAEVEFFSSRNMDPEAGAVLFNNYMKAVLDRKANLRFEVAADSLLASGIPSSFDKAWLSGDTGSSGRSAPADSLIFRRTPPKAKIRNDASEPLSGGRVWTFSNGIKVIFKQVSTPGTFRYTWLLKGGYASMPVLNPGEGGYMSDMLLLDKVAGVDGSAFSSLLACEGISLEPEVGLSDIRIGGVAPTRKLPLLMKALLALTHDRQTDRDAFNYYRKCEALSFSGDSRDRRRAILDSIMTQGMGISRYKGQAPLPDDFQRRAEAFFNTSFSKMNDGVLIIVGDFSEASLKKTLCQWIGGFETDKVASYRSRNRQGIVSGRRTLVSNSLRPGLDLSFSAPLDYTADNLLASTVAASAFADAISEAVALKGWSAEAESEFSMFPDERFKVNMFMTIADRKGMPASMMPTDSVEAVLGAVRKVVSRLASEGVRGMGTKAVQSYLTRSVASWNSDPERIVDMLLLRYSYGKDLMTMQKEKIASVTAEKVNSIVKALASGSIAEHAIRGEREVEKVTEPVLEEPRTPHFGPIAEPSDSTGMRSLYIELFGEDGLLRSGAAQVSGESGSLVRQAWISDFNAILEAGRKEEEQ